jgi:hypothetical protein
MNSTPTTATSTTRELALRQADRLSVRLLWHGDSNLTVKVEDGKTNKWFEFAVNPAEALKAFYHPYALRPAHTAPPKTAASTARLSTR